MKLKIGDIVECKKYENMNDDERMMISKNYFPSSGTVKKVENNCDLFNIVGSQCAFSKGSVSRVISDVDDVDISSLNPGDEVLVKATVKKVFDGFIQINSSVGRADVIEILKHKEPEHFIVQEDHYGMYISSAQELVIDKSKAKIYTSRDTAVKGATKMLPYDTWEVIPYDD